MKYIIEFNYEPIDLFAGPLDKHVKEFIEKLQMEQLVTNIKMSMHEEFK